MSLEAKNIYIIKMIIQSNNWISCKLVFLEPQILLLLRRFFSLCEENKKFINTIQCALANKLKI